MFDDGPPPAEGGADEFEDVFAEDAAEDGPPPRGRNDRDRDRGRGDRRDDRRRGPGGPGGPRKFGRDGGRPKPPIEHIFKRGQEVIVQVIKEGIGTKGPTLSTYISIAGRYLVLMPSLNRIGVSRKIVDEERARRGSSKPWPR